MARQNYSVKFGQQQLLIGPAYVENQNVPSAGAVFAAPCGLTGLTRNVVTNTADVSLPPCDDPEAVIWLGVDTVSKRMTLSFTGTLADVALPVWDDWSMGNAMRWVRWYRNLGAPNQGYWEGPAQLTDYTEESTDRGRYTNSGTIIFDGEPTWVSIPPAPSITTPVAIPLIAPVVGAAFAATPGTYTGAPTLSYQWFADGYVIPGANAVSFTPLVAHEGKSLRVSETATNTAGSMISQSPVSLPVEAA